MGKSKISIIIAREFATRVKKKSFIFTTILTPLLFACLMIVPSLIAVYSSGEEGLRICVSDESGIVMPYLESDEEVEFVPLTGMGLEQIRKDFDLLDAYAAVIVSPLDSLKNVSVSTYSRKQLNFDLQERIRRGVNAAVEDHKLAGYGIPELEEIMDDVSSDAELDTFVLDKNGEGKSCNVAVYMGIGYVASFLIYMFIFMFGSMVMRSVIEEKSTRIIEVIVSSVKPFQIMMGKILGVAAVALTQFFIWIILTVAIVMVAGSVLNTGEIMEMSAQMPQAAGTAVAAVPELSGAEEFLIALGQVDYLLIIGCFIVYFALGYLMYASMFAAVGASVDSEADTQQLILPITAPLIVGLFIMLHTFQYPDSALSFWGSVIPFTSPMVMMARIAYGVPAWELCLSIGLLVLSFVGMAYLSGKIYRVGILMHGKKIGWKELYKWLGY